MKPQTPGGVDKMTSSEQHVEFTIATTWDGRQLSHTPVNLCVKIEETGLQVDITAPYFNDPPNPGTPAGQPFDGLWDYEVVEIFFLNKDNRYIELEFCPHGQHLVLLLTGPRQMFKDKLQLDFTAKIDEAGKSWTGSAVIPWEYFPPNVTLVNAYAIHGSGKGRTYESLYPAPEGKYTNPDFHRLEYFRPLPDEFSTKLQENVDAAYPSQLWSGHT